MSLVDEPVTINILLQVTTRRNHIQQETSEYIKRSQSINSTMEHIPSLPISPVAAAFVSKEFWVLDLLQLSELEPIVLT